MSTSQEVLIRVQATPNPAAWKFVLNLPVLNEGKATYSDKQEAEHNNLASSLFQIDGVRQVHFFQNVITVTHQFDYDSDEVSKQVCAVIQTRMPVHNPNQTVLDEKKIARQNLSPDLQRIEEILDRTIRPGLQGDGGDIEVVKFEDNKVYVIYQGACGTCPSATTGTLMAIDGILKDEFDPSVEVIPL
ncbi:NifU family protein [Pseudobdellovibrio exovorus]|uniref:Putative nitrogen-fixing protein NifU n=1 Tax=Pseudobdellovibrio exovorus JSS TaxID=1184267 RepID=M4VBF1_9BACT|nr:NifU family protein [Pseudobdellovibrio exovorus]AGH96528.1 putative nitrogen-fixing protein NifU [Pseudobdellovibrio exovorus JSS]